MSDDTDYFMVSPNNTRIIGTLEKLVGRGEITCFNKLDDGKIDIVWDGYTEVFWDSQETVQRKGQRIFLDREGNEYPEDKCRLVTQEELDALEEEIE